MKHASPTRVVFVLALLLAAVTCLQSDEAVLAKEGAKKAGVVRINGPTTVPAFIREVEKQAPGFLTWKSGDKHVARAVLRGGAYSLDRERMARRLRWQLISQEIVLISTGTAEKPSYRITDMRAKREPGDPTLEPVRVEIGKVMPPLHVQRGYYVTTSIPTEGLSNLDAVQRVIQTVLTHSNVGRVTLSEDKSTFEVTDFAPNVWTAAQLAKELVALQAAGK